eukprot:jgi/Chrzof1/6368/Cz18g06010.t1
MQELLNLPVKNPDLFSRFEKHTTSSKVSLIGVLIAPWHAFIDYVWRSLLSDAVLSHASLDNWHFKVAIALILPMNVQNDLKLYVAADGSTEPPPDQVVRTETTSILVKELEKVHLHKQVRHSVERQQLLARSVIVPLDAQDAFYCA